VTRSDLVWTDGAADWLPAGQVREFAPAFASGGPPGPPAHAGPGYGPAYGAGVEPHRGSAVLTLGILGLAVCAICGIIAWVMGSSDLAKMRAGTMDRSGEGSTRAGMICGMISTILAAVALVVWLVILGGIASLGR
jgi:hypothetical protein